MKWEYVVGIVGQDVTNTCVTVASCDAFAAVHLRIALFWDTKLRHWVIGSRHFFLDVSTFENEDAPLLRNVRSQLPIDAVSCLSCLVVKQTMFYCRLKTERG
jgi:hypothetical protein